MVLVGGRGGGRLLKDSKSTNPRGYYDDYSLLMIMLIVIAAEHEKWIHRMMTSWIGRRRPLWYCGSRLPPGSISKVSFTSERRKFSGDRWKKCILPGGLCELSASWYRGNFQRRGIWSLCSWYRDEKQLVIGIQMAWGTMQGDDGMGTLSCYTP